MPEIIATYSDSWFFLFLIPKAQAPSKCVTCYVLVHKLHYVTWNFVCGECIYVLYPWNWCFLFRGHEDEMFQVILIWMKHLWMQFFSLFSFSGVFFHYIWAKSWLVWCRRWSFFLHSDTHVLFHQSWQKTPNSTALILCHPCWA
jgi:hypothetical protein